MLDLDARVHLDEIEAPVLEQEFERAGAAVPDADAGFHAYLADLCAQLGRDARRRRFFHHFLMPALHRAIALAQVNRVALAVGQHLDFHVTRVLQEFLHVDLRIAERRPRFGAGGRDGVAEVRLGVHDAHAAPAAAARGLDDYGIADLARDAHALVDVLAQRAAGTRHAGHPGGLHGLDGFDLVAHQADHRRGRTDEDEAGLLDRFGKIRVLRQKAIAGMDRRGVRHFRGSDDRGDVQITLRRRRGTDAYSLISHADVLEIAIDSGMHRNRFYSQRVASAQ